MKKNCKKKKEEKKNKKEFRIGKKLRKKVISVKGDRELYFQANLCQVS